MELWLRAGMSMNVTEGELEAFKQEPQRMFLEYVKEGKITFAGETYFPHIEENERYGMEEFDFVIEPGAENNEI